MAQGRAVFKAWPGLGFVSALALVLERWYGIGSWLVSTAKKNTKNGNASCQTRPFSRCR